MLPVHGFAVPFHINTIKNVSKNDEGDYTYLRINFQTPGQLAGKKDDTVRMTSESRVFSRLKVLSNSLSKTLTLLSFVRSPIGQVTAIVLTLFQNKSQT